MNDVLAILVSLAMGVSLAAAAGMRVFAPLLIAGLVLRTGLIPVPPALADANIWLASTPAITCFGAALIAEVLAYKIPVVDHLLDVLAAPAALAAGASLTTTFLVGVDDPLWRYGLGIIAGATTAGTVHAGTAALRVASTKATAGLANPFFALSELASSVVTALLSFVVPTLIVGLIFVIGVVMFLKTISWRRQG